MQYKCHICNKKATWDYAPSSPVLEFYNRFFCDDCVPRGCSCQCDEDGMPYTDSNGKEYPCIEYFEEPNGWDMESYDYSYILVNKAYEKSSQFKQISQELEQSVKSPFPKYTETVLTDYARKMLDLLIDSGYIIVNKEKLPHDILK